MSKILIAIPSLGRNFLLPLRKANALKTTMEKAMTLEKSGYKIEPVVPEDGLFFCRAPKTVVLPDGRLADGYFVDVCKQQCECWVWVNNAAEGIRTCKHTIHCTEQVEKSLRILGLWNSPESIDEVIRRTS